MGEGEYTVELLADLAAAALRCRGGSINVISYNGAETDCLLAFTSQQVHQFIAFLEASSIPIPTTLDLLEDDHSSNSTIVTGQSQPLTPATGDLENSFLQLALTSTTSHRPQHEIPANMTTTNATLNLNEIAKEFGVEAQLVQALAQRLSELR